MTTGLAAARGCGNRGGTRDVAEAETWRGNQEEIAEAKPKQPRKHNTGNRGGKQGSSARRPCFTDCERSRAGHWVHEGRRHGFLRRAATGRAQDTAGASGEYSGLRTCFAARRRSSRLMAAQSGIIATFSGRNSICSFMPLPWPPIRSS